MKIILNESQYNLVLEQVGLDIFVEQMNDAYPDSIYAMDTIVDFIRKSGCQKIEILDFKHPAYGAALHDRVIINKLVLNRDLTTFLYVVFHEIAHQYQYKKYGIDKMYGCYTGDISIEEGAEFMKYVENVADEFAVRKIRQLDKLYKDRLNLKVDKIVKAYQNSTTTQFEGLIRHIIKLIRDNNYNDKEEISEIMYNYIKK